MSDENITSSGLVDYSPDDITVNDFTGKPYSIFYNPRSEEYSIYISTGLFAQNYYDYLCEFLNSLNRFDKLCLYINCDGGILATFMALDMAFGRCKAEKRCVVQGETSSGGAMLACTFEDLYVYPYTTLMFHNMSVGCSGNINITRRIINMTDKTFNTMFHDKYSHILTKEEIDNILTTSYDHYFTGEEINKRVEANKKRKK